MDLKTFKMYSVQGMDNTRKVPLSPSARKLKPPIITRKPSVVELIRQKTETDTSLSYQDQFLSIVVVGASGDLAKKKTYPSLFQLFSQGFLTSNNFNICGYARSNYTDESFQEKMRGALTKKFQGKGFQGDIEKFLSHCRYSRGNAYNDVDAWTLLNETQVGLEGSGETVNRLFYFALPPSQFAPAAAAITKVAQTTKGWNRFIVEKPFGVDSESSLQLSKDLAACLREEQIYRIDHYLGKEMVQNLMVLRFANIFLSPLWNRDHIKSVIITFKEDIGCDGRGGYFDSAGIIRDVMQNHLLQILSITAMEPPVKVTGEGHSEYVRDEKVKVLRCIKPLTTDDVILGQYTKGNGHVGYLDDATCNNPYCPTFCMAQFEINNPRWDGVPFIMKAGKALDSRKGEIRIQLKNPPGFTTMFNTDEIPHNELVIRVQPDEDIYMKMNVKMPGLTSTPMISEMDLNYKNRFPELAAGIPDAYTRLILDVLRGQQAAFVRDDELDAAWAIFTPLLHKLEEGDESQKILPTPYAFGSRGPPEADAFLQQIYVKSEYVYSDAIQNGKRSNSPHF